MFLSWFRRFRDQPIAMTERQMRLKWLIKHEIEKNATVMLLYVDMVKLTEIENRYGDHIAKQVLQRYEKIIFSVSRVLFGINGKLLGVQKLWGDDFAIYVSFPKGANEEEIRLLSISFQERVEELLNRQGSLGWRGDLKVHIGYALFAGEDIVKEMYTSVKRAVQMAKYGIGSEMYANVARFHRVLAEEAIHTVYMPIVSLHDGEPLGWEALSRGPENSPFHTPAQLFAYAEETDTVFRLEQICHRRALEQLPFLEPSQKLFINLDPLAVDDPFLLRGDLFTRLEQWELHPQNIVLEITEKHAIRDFRSFRKIMEEYRRRGYQIAVDDAGAGYSSLETITEIYPDYIKLDMSLIRNIDMDSIKQALLETFVQFTEKVKCSMIAEGVETEGELQTLLELNVPYAQGYYLGKPQRGFTKTSGEALVTIQLAGEKRREAKRVRYPHSPEVGEILAKTVCVERNTRVRQVHHLFEQNQRIDSIVVLEGDVPVGLVMRFQLYQVLGGQYGIALYYDRPVSHIMNSNPLLVGMGEKINEVARRAMARGAYHLYDVIVVVDEHGKYKGIVSVQSLLDKIASIELELATFANPLTGLPGNLWIDREIAARLASGPETVVIYCDLDRFKWFNDQYGFEVGDQIIQRTSELLKESVERHGGNQAFVGHIGGDDFIVMVSADREEAVTRYILDNFRGYFQDIYKKCRTPGEGPDLSMSMAGVTVSKGRFSTVEEIAQRAAQVKRLAKARQGTVYLSDADVGQEMIPDLRLIEWTGTDKIE